MHTFWKVFLPLFVAIDPPGVLSIFFSLTQGMDTPQKRRTARSAVLTAFLTVLFFDVFGTSLLEFLGLSLWDFTLAGGILLLVLSISDLLKHQDLKESQGLPRQGSIGAVPLGIPLIAGPATLTTSLIVSKSYSVPWALAGLAVNMILLFGILLMADRITKAIGQTMSSAIGKIFSLVLAAIAIHLIHQGITGLLNLTGR
ncbi:MAG: MarC family protein [Nitrospirota bacterium]|nr:MarC family protein [Nitrospirota bacterium]